MLFVFSFQIISTIFYKFFEYCFLLNLTAKYIFFLKVLDIPFTVIHLHHPWLRARLLNFFNWQKNWRWPPIWSTLINYQFIVIIEGGWVFWGRVKYRYKSAWTSLNQRSKHSVSLAAEIVQWPQDPRNYFLKWSIFTRRQYEVNILPNSIAMCG